MSGGDDRRRAIWSLGLHAQARAADGGPKVRKATFGQLPDGTVVDRYTLTNAAGLEASVMTLGATLISVKTPDRAGKFDEITLHLDTLDDYRRGHPLFGSVVGRYANRIAGAKFTLDGVEYPLTPNAGGHHIHGGREGFQNIVWKAGPGRNARQRRRRALARQPRRRTKAIRAR